MARSGAGRFQESHGRSVRGASPAIATCGAGPLVRVAASCDRTADLGSSEQARTAPVWAPGPPPEVRWLGWVFGV